MPIKVRGMWEQDILGPGFTYRHFDMHSDDDGPVRTTLIRYTPADDPQALPGTPSTPHFAMLAIHGWNDYFYHAHFARRIAHAGGAFFAIDLRKYGRSMFETDTPGYMTDISVYDEDIRVARRAIYELLGEGTDIVLYGHSTGGLTAALWADRHPGALRGLVLNSPWLELQASDMVRTVSRGVVDAVRKRHPKQILPLPDNGFYQRLLTGYGLENDPDQDDPFVSGWNPDPRWRWCPGFPVRAGWLGAILDGHDRVTEGLRIDCPILMLTSGKSLFEQAWSDDMRGADTVLDVEKLWQRASILGTHMTLIKCEGAIHDVLLSRRAVRDFALDEMEHWLGAYVDRAHRA